jgi:hypothetical protein
MGGPSTFRELTNVTFEQMQQATRTPLSAAESRQVARVALQASVVFGVVLTVVLLNYSIRWYIALPASFIGAWAFLAGSAIGVAHQRKRSRNPRSVVRRYRDSRSAGPAPFTKCEQANFSLSRCDLS